MQSAGSRNHPIRGVAEEFRLGADAKSAQPSCPTVLNQLRDLPGGAGDLVRTTRCGDWDFTGAKPIRSGQVLDAGRVSRQPVLSTPACRPPDEQYDRVPLRPCSRTPSSRPEYRTFYALQARFVDRWAAPALR